MIMLTTDQIKEIAENLDCGFTCYVKKEKYEHVFFMNGYDDTFLGEKLEDPWESEKKKIDDNPGEYLYIEKMESWDSFKIMESFVDLVDSKKLKNDLIYALNKNKPFSRFKNVIDYSGDYRQLWFDHKAACMQEWVKDQIDAFNLRLVEDDDE